MRQFIRWLATRSPESVENVSLAVGAAVTAALVVTHLREAGVLP